jgi:hypothetical protein
MMWHGLKVGVLSLEHRPSHRYLDMRQECRTFNSVASRPCDWLLVVLDTRARGAPLDTKNRWKHKMRSKAFEDGT